MTRPQRTSRRGLILGTAALGAVAWGWQRFGVGAPEARFTDIPGLPGWRRVAYDGVSLSQGAATDGVFLGIGGADEGVEPLDQSDLCAALYRPTPEDIVPVAMFSDYFCPYCRTLSTRIARLADNPDTGIALTWHELPLLGPTSELAAKAALAADMQGRYAAFQTALFSTPFRPSPAHLDRLAASAGLDRDRFAADMESERVTERLRTTRRAAEKLEIWGTPALTIGRTLVTGAIGEEELTRIIDEERDHPSGYRAVCAT